jgi:hypothetical protein
MHQERRHQFTLKHRRASGAHNAPNALIILELPSHKTDGEACDENHSHHGVVPS